MRKTFTQIVRLAMLVVTVALLSGMPLAAQAPNAAPNGNPASRAPISLPAQAVEVAPGLYYLGVTMVHGQRIEGYAFVRYDKAHAKPGGGGNTGTSSCYTFLASGARWKTVEQYIVDPTNTRGLDAASVRQVLADGIGKWEDAADGAYDGHANIDIIGTENTAGTVSKGALGTMNGQNEVFFGNIAQSGAIAITYIWGNFGGPTATRQLVEWDQVYDDVDYGWSIGGAGVAGKMDFDNIATHELGHSVGMGDLYTSKCSAMTMYGYAGYAETAKRSLENGDIAGISILY